jgi:hypothetical protein
VKHHFDLPCGEKSSSLGLFNLTAAQDFDGKDLEVQAAREGVAGV